MLQPRQKREETAVEKINTILRELREKYKIQRSELLHNVTEQVCDLRTELDAARYGAKECEMQVEHIRTHLVALETAHDGPVDLMKATQEANKRLNVVHDGLRRVSEETQLIKAAVLNDRMRRQARERQLSAEEAELELRLKQMEELNNQLRSELHVVKTVNAETNHAVLDLVHQCKIDAPGAHAAGEMQRLYEEVMSDLRQLKGEHAQLSGKLSSIVGFCEEEEDRRAKQVNALAASVKQLQEKGIRAPTYKPVVDTRLYDPASVGAPPIGLVHTPRRTASNSVNLEAANTYAAPSPPVSFRSSTWQEPKESVREKIAGFYERYNPEKLHTLDDILQEYEGATEELMAALEVHYGAFGYFTSC